MTSVSDLTLAFIDRRPAAAARILAANLGADAVAFISTIPTRHACKLLATLNARVAGEIVRELDPVAGSAIIRDSEFVEATAMLRQLAPADREALLAGLPAQLRLRLNKSLSFNPNVVGAHMTTDFYLLSASDTCGTAITAVKSDPRAQCDVVFIQDQQQKYQGTVRLLTLLQRPAQLALIDLADASAVALSAHASIKTVANLGAWNDFTTLPVISRRGHVVGALRRRSLESTGAIAPPAARATDYSFLGETLSALSHGVGGLLGLALAPSPAHSKPGQSSER